MAYKMIAGFGFEEEWGKFIQRHLVFFEKLPLLRDTYIKIFIRTVTTDDLADRVVFFLGRTVVEEFNEILLLCGNGYGIGGFKLLRGMFERVTTALYISAHREEAQKFFDFYNVERRKLLNQIKDVADINKMFPRETLEQIETDYHRVKSQFTETCKKCGTTRPQISWTKLNLVSMAKKVGLANFVVPCYSDPTLQAHSTVSALMERINLCPDGGLSFDEGSQHKRADYALMGAHGLLLAILECQDKHFNLGLQEEIQSRGSEFFECWQVNG